MTPQKQTIDFRSEKWFRVPTAVILEYGPVLGPHGIAVYVALCARLRKGAAWPSHQRLAETVGVSRRTVIRELKKLETLRLVAVDRQMEGQSANRYTLLPPPLSREGKKTSRDGGQRVTISDINSKAPSTPNNELFQKLDTEPILNAQDGLEGTPSVSKGHVFQTKPNETNKPEKEPVTPPRPLPCDSQSQDCVVSVTSDSQSHPCDSQSIQPVTVSHTNKINRTRTPPIVPPKGEVMDPEEPVFLAVTDLFADAADPGDVPEPAGKKSTRGGKRTSRQPNELFDAIANVCGLDPNVKLHAKAIKKAEMSLREHTPPITPEEVYRFAKEIWPTKPFAKGPPAAMQLPYYIQEIRRPPYGKNNHVSEEILARQRAQKRELIRQKNGERTEENLAIFQALKEKFAGNHSQPEESRHEELSETFDSPGSGDGGDGLPF